MFRRLLALALLLAPLSAVAAGSNVVIQTQGRLLGNEDQPLEGPQQLSVLLYSSASGGVSDLVWSQTYDVTLQRGVYTIAIGDTRNGQRALTTEDIAGDRWMAVAVGTQELSPRLPLRPVPSAVSARLFDGHPVSDFVLKGEDAANALKLGGVEAAQYALKSDTVANALKLDGQDPSVFALKTDTAPNALKLAGQDPSAFALKTDTSPNALKLAGQDPSVFALKTDTAPNALKLAGQDPSVFALKTDTAPNALKLAGQDPSAFAAANHNHDGVYVKLGGTGDLTISGTASLGLLAFTAPPATIPACTGTAAGKVYFDPTTKDFLGCDGTAWLSLTGRSIGTSPTRPGKSCLDIKQKWPAASDGIYWIDPDGTGTEAPFQVVCDQTRDGGGWTLGLKVWYQSGINGQTRAVGQVADALAHKGYPYKLSDTQIRNLIGDRNFDVLADESGYNSAYSTGNYEYVILRNYTGDWTFANVMPESTTVTTMQSYRAADNALAWTGRLQCGVAGSAGINCYNVISGTNPQGGAGCNINMGSSSSSGWHHFYMSETNSDTYLYVCNGAQHSSSYDMNHRFWFR